MENLYYYSVRVVLEKGIIDYSNSFSVENRKVLGENENFLCIEDEHFTTIQKKGKDYNVYDVLNKPSISIYNKDNCFGTSIRYTVYTTTNKRPSTIRKEIQDAVHKKFGVFSGKIDLSFIK